MCLWRFLADNPVVAVVSDEAAQVAWGMAVDAILERPTSPGYPGFEGERVFKGHALPGEAHG